MSSDFEFVEGLLKHYKAIKARIFNLNQKLTLINIQKNNAIEGQYLRAQQINDMPGAPMEGMKKPKLMLIDDVEYEDLCNEESLLKDEISILMIIKDCMDESINSLNPVEKAIIVSFYIEHKGWIEITNLVHYRERNCKYIKKQALGYLYKSLEPYRKEAIHLCTIFALLDRRNAV